MGRGVNNFNWVEIRKEVVISLENKFLSVSLIE